MFLHKNFQNAMCIMPITCEISAEDRPQSCRRDLVAATFPGAATLRLAGLPSLLGLAKEVEESLAPSISLLSSHRS
ncbi:hypothetical protein GGD56_000341 [Rhizobium mongolense]|uniref:Uncharacterized protein n=2 Tax=Rhizobium mongolense TaxID=57676 RepID=A0ABR6IF74_9HYPH|nr:hypothetical protein [Rhizobium mongolense]TVZ73789.1 hypothetical protein BCL32_2049 [Rhizobium mongolense USDA 1844]